MLSLRQRMEITQAVNTLVMNRVESLVEEGNYDVEGQTIVGEGIIITIVRSLVTPEELVNGAFQIEGTVVGILPEGIIVRATLFPVTKRGSEEHGRFGRSVQTFEQLPLEDLLLAVRPRQGIRKPDPVFGTGAPSVEVKYEGIFPPIPLQDDRAAALYVVLRELKWNERHPIIRVLSALAPDAFIHLHNIIGDELISSEGRGPMALASYLLPYGQYMAVRDAGVKIFAGKHVPKSAQEYAHDIWSALVAEPAMRLLGEEFLSRMGGVAKAISGRSPNMSCLIKSAPGVLEAVREIQGKYTRARQLGENPPSREKAEQAVKMGIEWLLDVRASIPISAAVLPADTIGYAFPAPVRTVTDEGGAVLRPTDNLQDLMSWLLPASALRSARGKFAQTTRPAMDPSIVRETAEALVTRSEHGIISREELIRKICGGLRDVVVVVDASESMEQAVGFLRSFIEDVGRLYPHQLDEWAVVLINRGEVRTYTAREIAGTRIVASGPTPLYPAMHIARELGKTVGIVITDWRHNVDEAWYNNSVLRVPRPERPAKHVLFLSMRGGTAPLLPEEEGITLEIQVGQRAYLEILPEIAEFAEMVAARTLTVEITEKEGWVRMLFRRV